MKTARKDGNPGRCTAFQVSFSLAGRAGETTSRAAKEGVLSSRTIGSVLSDGGAGIVHVPQALEGLGGDGADITAAGDVVVVRGIPGAQLLPSAALKGSANSIGVVDINSASGLVVGSTRGGCGGDIASTSLEPLVQQELLGEGAKSRVDGHVATIAAAGAAEGSGGGSLEVRNTSGSSAQGDAAEAVHSGEQTRLQAVGGLNKLTGELRKRERVDKSLFLSREIRKRG